MTLAQQRAAFVEKWHPKLTQGHIIVYRDNRVAMAADLDALLARQREADARIADRAHPLGETFQPVINGYREAARDIAAAIRRGTR